MTRNGSECAVLVTFNISWQKTSAVSEKRCALGTDHELCIKIRIAARSALLTDRFDQIALHFIVLILQIALITGWEHTVISFPMRI